MVAPADEAEEKTMGTVTVKPLPSPVGEPSAERVEEISKQLDEWLVEIDRLHKDIQRNHEQTVKSAAKTRAALDRIDVLLSR